MANYIGLQTLEKVLGSKFPADLLSEKGVEELSDLLVDPTIQQELVALGYTEIDLREYRELLSPTTLLFQRWIESNTALYNLINSGVLAEYRDAQGLASHRLFSDFKVYVSRYLTNRLLALQPQSNETVLLELSSYLPLLDDDNRYVVEDQLFKTIQKGLEQIEKNCLNWATETVIMAEVMPLVSDEIIERMNASSKASYSNKLFYVDTLLKTLYAPGCTPRFANWLIKRLELLDLNQEHQERITQFKRDLASGELKVRNTTFVKGKGKRRILPALVLLSLSALVFWVVYFKPFNQKDAITDKRQSSFAELTEQERREIDSLVQTMNTGIIPDGEELDPGVFSGGTVLSLRTAFQNELMEQIYEDHNRDARLSYLFPADSCGKGIKFMPYVGAKAINKNKSGAACVLRNESDYQLVVYVADNKVGGNVYTTDLKKGEIMEFTFAKGQVITVVAGEKFAPFVPPVGATNDQLPSPAYAQHFCERDHNFEETINRSFVMHSQHTKGKFVVAGKKGQYVQFIDLTSVTDPY